MSRLRRVGLVVLVLVVVGSAGGVAHPDQSTAEATVERTATGTVDAQSTAGSVDSLSTAGSVSATSDDQIRMTTTLDRTPETTGEITATVSFELSSRVTEFTARLPEGVTVTETNGFSAETEQEYVWDERTDEPTVSFRVEADRLVDEEGPLAEDGRYLFADTDEWALVRIPSTGARWSRTGGESDDLEFVRETAIEGPGAAGDRMAFLGDHRIETRTAHGQTFRLVVPEAAELDASVDEIFASLSYASDALRVGERDEELFIVAAPTDSVGWAVRGLQTGSSDMWVQDTEPVDSPLNVWVHEYVHTRQGYEPTDETRWVTEATATYYAALLTLEENRIEFEAFEQYLRQGTDEPQSTAVLSEPSSWENDAEYRKGALVAGELDRQIRVVTDSGASHGSVFRSLNCHDGALSAVEFERYVTDASTTTVGAAATRYTTTDETPAMWSADQHAAAFGQTPARFSFELVDEPITVTGPDGSRAVDGTNLTLSTGETLRVELQVTNTGGTVGRYELPFAVESESSTESGRLDPGETATHEFSHTFDEPGSYTVAVGNERLEIRVSQPESEPTELPTDIEVPGFGLSTAVAAMLLGLLAATRRATRS